MPPVSIRAGQAGPTAPLRSLRSPRFNALLRASARSVPSFRQHCALFSTSRRICSAHVTRRSLRPRCVSSAPIAPTFLTAAEMSIRQDCVPPARRAPAYTDHCTREIARVYAGQSSVTAMRFASRRDGTALALCGARSSKWHEDSPGSLLPRLLGTVRLVRRRHGLSDVTPGDTPRTERCRRACSGDTGRGARRVDRSVEGVCRHATASPVTTSG